MVPPNAEPHHHREENPKKRQLPVLIESALGKFLDIVTPNNLFTISCFKFRRRSSSSDEIESQIDQKTEASLQQSAARNNLSREEVKSILKVSRIEIYCDFL